MKPRVPVAHLNTSYWQCLAFRASNYINNFNRINTGSAFKSPSWHWPTFPSPDGHFVELDGGHAYAEGFYVVRAKAKANAGPSTPLKSASLRMTAVY